VINKKEEETFALGHQHKNSRDSNGIDSEDECSCQLLT